MSGPIAAVGTDTYSGLSGYKRQLQGNPTRVPGSLPAFRGTPSKPGSNIKTPAIKSSSNRPSRGTNITIPYARQTPLDHTNNLGRLASGDVAFVSRDRPNLPGFAHSRYTRLLGVDAVNRFMSNPFWSERGGDGVFRHILTVTQENDNVADNWRAVPFLGEWSCDGIVMSSEAPEVSGSSGKLDSQLYNIAVQGICPVNNGYIDTNAVGQISRALASHATDDPAKYTGANYHLYPLQMFDRGISPLNELFVGLVATKEQPQAGIEVEFYSFKFVLFTSRNAMELNINQDGANPDGADIFVPLNYPTTKRLKSEYDSAEQRTTDFKNMVGAWRVGKVIDVKAQKMPWFPTGPSETGYRVTTNVDIEWWDWRKLRRTYTNSNNAEVQIGEDLSGAKRWGGAGVNDDQLALYWPTYYDPKKPADYPALDPGSFFDTNSASRATVSTAAPPITAAAAAATRTAAPPITAAAAATRTAAPPITAAATTTTAAAAPPITAAATTSATATATPAVAAVAPPATASTPAVAAVAPPATASTPSNKAADTGTAMGDDVVMAPSPARAASGGRRARSATVASDVFSNIFGSSAGTEASAPQPLNPQHRSSPGGVTTGRSFSRRKGAKDSLDN